MQTIAVIIRGNKARKGEGASVTHATPPWETATLYLQVYFFCLIILNCIANRPIFAEIFTLVSS